MLTYESSSTVCRKISTMWDWNILFDWNIRCSISFFFIRRKILFSFSLGETFYSEKHPFEAEILDDISICNIHDWAGNDLFTLYPQLTRVFHLKAAPWCSDAEPDQHHGQLLQSWVAAMIHCNPDTPPPPTSVTFITTSPLKHELIMRQWAHLPPLIH